jgi:hypothetical protein
MILKPIKATQISKKGIYIAMMDGCSHCVKLKSELKKLKLDDRVTVTYSTYPESAPREVNLFPQVFIHGFPIKTEVFLDLLKFLSRHKLFFLVK